MHLLLNNYMGGQGAETHRNASDRRDILLAILTNLGTSAERAVFHNGGSMDRTEKKMPFLGWPQMTDTKRSGDQSENVDFMTTCRAQNWQNRYPLFQPQWSWKIWRHDWASLLWVYFSSYFLQYQNRNLIVSACPHSSLCSGFPSEPYLQWVFFFWVSQLYLPESVVATILDDFNLRAFLRCTFIHNLVCNFQAVFLPHNFLYICSK